MDLRHVVTLSAARRSLAAEGAQISLELDLGRAGAGSAIRARV